MVTILVFGVLLACAALVSPQPDPEPPASVQCDAPHPSEQFVRCERAVAHELPHGARNPQAPGHGGDAFDEWWDTPAPLVQPSPCGCAPRSPEPEVEP